MDVLTKTKLKLAKMLNIRYEAVETDKGPLHFDGDQITEGMAVFIMDAQGNLEPAPDGDYTLDDGRVAVVENGTVTRIDDGSEEEAETEMEEVVVETDEVSAEDFNDLVQIVNALNTELTDLKEEVQELEVEVKELDADYSREKKAHQATRDELAKIKADFARAVSGGSKAIESGNKTVRGSFKTEVDERIDKAIKFMAGK